MKFRATLTGFDYSDYSHVAGDAPEFPQIECEGTAASIEDAEQQARRTTMYGLSGDILVVEELPS